MSNPDAPSWLTELVWKAVEALGLALGAVFAWFVKRDVNRFDKALEAHTMEIGELQRDRVTRKDFDELRSSLTAAITHGFDRAEEKIDKRHDENGERHRKTDDDIQYIRERLDKALDK
jgi:hypothetical protein